MSCYGDVMVCKGEAGLGQTREFDAHIQVLDFPDEIKLGCSLISFVGCSCSACRMSKLKRHMGKGKEGTTMEDSHPQGE